MPEPYSEEHAALAEEILGRAFKELTAAGLGGIEACHALVHMGVDTLPAFACRCCLPAEYEASAEALEDRIAEVLTMTEIAACLH